MRRLLALGTCLLLSTACDPSAAAKTARDEVEKAVHEAGAAAAGGAQAASAVDAKGCLSEFGYVWNEARGRCMDRAGACNQGFTLDANKGECELNQAVVCMLPESDPLSAVCEAKKAGGGAPAAPAAAAVGGQVPAGVQPAATRVSDGPSRAAALPQVPPALLPGVYPCSFTDSSGYHYGSCDIREAGAGQWRASFSGPSKNESGELDQPGGSFSGTLSGGPDSFRFTGEMQGFANCRGAFDTKAVREVVNLRAEHQLASGCKIELDLEVGPNPAEMPVE